MVQRFCCQLAKKEEYQDGRKTRSSTMHFFFFCVAVVMWERTEVRAQLHQCCYLHFYIGISRCWSYKYTSQCFVKIDLESEEFFVSIIFEEIEYIWLLLDCASLLHESIIYTCGLQYYLGQTSEKHFSFSAVFLTTEDFSLVFFFILIEDVAI